MNGQTSYSRNYSQDSDPQPQPEQAARGAYFTWRAVHRPDDGGMITTWCCSPGKEHASFGRQKNLNFEPQDVLQMSGLKSKRCLKLHCKNFNVEPCKNVTWRPETFILAPLDQQRRFCFGGRSPTMMVPNTNQVVFVPKPDQRSSSVTTTH